MAPSSHRWTVTASLALLSLTIAVSSRADKARSCVLLNPLSSLETNLAGWSVERETKMTDEVLDVLKPSSYLMRTYKRENLRLELLIVFFNEQKEGATTHSPKNCLQGTGWEIWNATTMEIDPRVKVNRIRLQSLDSHLVGLYWYQSPRGIYTNEYVGKILLLRDALFNIDTSETMVWVTLPDSPKAIAEGLDFIRPLIRRLGPLLRCSSQPYRQ